MKITAAVLGLAGLCVAGYAALRTEVEDVKLRAFIGTVGLAAIVLAIWMV